MFQVMPDWFCFNSECTVPMLDDVNPSSSFYGISQGGILGAGYTALSGPTKLIDRSVLGVPGTVSEVIAAVLASTGSMT